LIEESGIRLWFPWVTHNLGLAYAFCGQAQRAIQLIESGLAALAAMGITLYRSWLLASLTEAHLMQDDLERARRRADETLQTAEQYKEYGIKVRALRLRGEVASRGGHGDACEAVRWFEAAMALAHELGTRPHLAHSHLGLGRHYARVDEAVRAKKHLNTALSMYREMHMRYWPEQAETALTRVA
jgi:tetratricopeptide (TPR) repeat protein